MDLTKEDRGGMSDNAMTAMIKLSESMVRYQEATAKVQESKSDSRLKAWNKLPCIQQNIILLAGADS